MIHSACVESWDAETGKGRGAPHHRAAARISLTAMPEQLQVRSSVGMEERAQARTRSTPSTSRRTSPRRGRAGQPAGAQHRQGLAPAVRRTHRDGGGGRCTGHSHGAGVAGQQALALKPGTFHPTYSRGLHAVLPEGVRGQAEPLTLALDLELVGTERLSIVPLGGNTDVKMTGSWPHPSFNGRFCRQSAPGGRGLHGPVAPVIAGHHGAAGCAGRPPHLRWQLRRCPTDHAPTGTTPRDCADSFGVAFVDPVNPTPWQTAPPNTACCSSP